MIRLSHAAVAVALLAADPALAASDGTLGATSTGSSNISLTVAGTVKITNVNDIALGTTSPDSFSMDVRDSVCVYSNAGSRHSFYLTASSANASGIVFRLRNGSSYIHYDTWFGTNSNNNNNEGFQLGSAYPQGPFEGSGSQNCNGSTNSFFRVTVYSNDWDGAPSGNYTDTLYLLVQPGGS
ncbi:MAG: hypothetical protein U1E17_13355 [Geminicoccaceae bacterium]